MTGLRPNACAVECIRVEGNEHGEQKQCAYYGCNSNCPNSPRSLQQLRLWHEVLSGCKDDEDGGKHPPERLRNEHDRVVEAVNAGQTHEQEHVARNLLKPHGPRERRRLKLASEEWRDHDRAHDVHKHDPEVSRKEHDQFFPRRPNVELSGPRRCGARSNWRKLAEGHRQMREAPRRSGSAAAPG